MTRSTLLFSILALVAMQACMSDRGSSGESSEENINNEIIVEGETMLYGEVTRKGFEMPEYRQWFDSTYQGYVPREDILAQLNPLIGSVDIRIYLATWCSDTQRDIPAFFRILDEMDQRPGSLEMFALDRDMSSPGGEEEGNDIGFVPTTIFYRDGSEIGRIIEYPNLTMEEDMLAIVGR